MIYVTQDVVELAIQEHAAVAQQCIDRNRRSARSVRTPQGDHFGDQAMIWVASGLAAALALVLWL